MPFIVIIQQSFSLCWPFLLTSVLSFVIVIVCHITYITKSIAITITITMGVLKNLMWMHRKQKNESVANFETVHLLYGSNQQFLGKWNYKIHPLWRNFILGTAISKEILVPKWNFFITAFMSLLCMPWQHGFMGFYLFQNHQKLHWWWKWQNIFQWWSFSTSQGPYHKTTLNNTSEIVVVLPGHYLSHLPFPSFLEVICSL